MTPTPCRPASRWARRSRRRSCAPAPKGVAAVTLDRGFPPDLAERAPWLLLGAKPLSYAMNMAAVREAGRRGAEDVIFTAADGSVFEGPTSTVVLAKGRTLYTPPSSIGILPGTTQAALFRGAEKAGWSVKVEPLTGCRPGRGRRRVHGVARAQADPGAHAGRLAAAGLVGGVRRAGGGLRGRIRLSDPDDRGRDLFGAVGGDLVVAVDDQLALAVGQHHRDRPVAAADGGPVVADAGLVGRRPGVGRGEQLVVRAAVPGRSRGSRRRRAGRGPGRAWWPAGGAAARWPGRSAATGAAPPAPACSRRGNPCHR